MLARLTAATLCALALIILNASPTPCADATWAWNQNAATYNFDTVTSPIPASTTLLSLYNGSGFATDFIRIWAAVGADMDDPRIEPIEPESAEWSEILNW